MAKVREAVARLRTRKPRPPKFEEIYRLDKLLGEGGQAKVFACRHKTTEWVMAVKIFTAELSSALKEAQMCRQLAHPNVLLVQEQFQEPGRLCIIQELMVGGDLFAYLSDHPNGLEEEMARSIIHQLLSALMYLHERNIIHRDIKPDNILLPQTSTDRVVLGDFGMAVELKGPAAKTKGYVGTPEYISPEVVEGRWYGCGTDL